MVKMRKLTIILVLIVFLIFNSCGEVFDPDFPLKDDPTTVGNFESSKFDGTWEVKNINIDWSSPPIYDYQLLFYVFNKNTFQYFGKDRDWSTVNGELTGEIIGDGEIEFMYSNTHIYTVEFRNSKTWKKTGYRLSSDGNNLTYGKNILERIDDKPWTEEELINYLNNN
jgi:hypothetical protein